MTNNNQMHTYLSVDERLHVRYNFLFCSVLFLFLVCASELDDEAKLTRLLNFLSASMPHTFLLIPGLNGDDFLAVGLHNGSVVYTYNLGSGTANISSDPLDLSLAIHTVRLGRFFRMGWLKVKYHPFFRPAALLSITICHRICAVEARGSRPMLPAPHNSQKMPTAEAHRKCPYH